MEFLETEPTLDNYWRSIILFGRNTASYKFALAKALVELGATPGSDLITLGELAEPFSRHLCAHLKEVDKQGARPTGRFLDACRDFNAERIGKDELVRATSKLGFINVIDAFHVVNQGEVEQKFFIDERKESKGIRITTNLYELFAGKGTHSLLNETEARWRLVETAWQLNMSRQLVAVRVDEGGETLFADVNHKRVGITSCRDALNGYQKGRCFYCFRPIEVTSGHPSLADVDHFFPFMLGPLMPDINVNGIWNLVLACNGCNRGEGGKFARVPSLNLLKRLSKRNEYLITSHHPLRETLVRQTGIKSKDRQQFLQGCHGMAVSNLLHRWEPSVQGNPAF
ncbi:hypothetical protein [Marinobacter sp.]|uniref:hypothetical protein n=1 Tax=Marinobacter sp. TaxID=50741 RepID=UPI00385049E3